MNLETNYRSEVTLLPDVIIDDVHSSDKMEFPIHIDTNDTPHSFFFTLKSKDELEYRFYKVDFVCGAFTKTKVSNEKNGSANETIKQV